MANGRDEFRITRGDLIDAVFRGRDYAIDIGVFDALRRPYIDGVEVTQAIQYYGADRHLTNANDRGPNNSVRLVAAKPAWVRVYVRTGLLGADTNVTGDLVVERQNAPLLIFQNLGTLSTVGPSAVMTPRNPDYATERSTLVSALNFIVPADMMWGRMRLTARIWPQSAGSTVPVSTFVESIDATLLQTLRLRGIFISYNGPTSLNPGAPTVTLTAPTLADLQTTAAWTLTTNPVQSQGNFSSAGTLAWSTPLTGVALSPGGCSTQWLNLNAAVAQVKANDGNRSDLIYYGLLPAATPIANVGGCESSGVSTGPNGQQQTMAHEVGHGAGLAHGPCGTPGDGNYPAYEPYDPANVPTASLGEYGLNINSGTIHPPAEKDYMSYCGPVWISLYHHTRLINNAKFDPRTVGIAKFREPILVDPYLWPWEYIPDPPPWERFPGDLRMKAEPVISIIGIVTDRRDVQVQSVMRVTALPAVQNAARTTFVAELVGKDGSIVARAPIMRLEAHGCGCTGGHHAEDDAYVFQALVPATEAGAALRIVKRDENTADVEVWRRRASERQPKIERLDVRVSGGEGVARWEARGFGEVPLEFSLQFSKDKGTSWNGLAVGLRENTHTFALAELPSGPVLFRLLAHDGFFSAEATSKSLTLPKRGPTVSILHPQDGPVLIADHPMRLWGAVSTATGELVDPETCGWLVDGKLVARGTEAWIEAPKDGTHRCTFVVDSDQGKSDATVSFRTSSTGAPDEPRPLGTKRAARTRRTSAKTRKGARKR